MVPPVTIKSYLPQEKRERSNLQMVKDKHRSFIQTNKEGIPKDLNELKAIKYREHAISFLNQYMNINNKKMSKSIYCKTNHISHNSLNSALKLLGFTSHVKEPISRPIEPIPDQSRPIETDQTKPVKIKRKMKKETSEIKGGMSYENKNFHEEMNKSFANLSVLS